MENSKIYKLRFWYALQEHIVEIGTADFIIQELFSEFYPTVTVESKIWKKSNALYQLTINFKEMTLKIDKIDDDGETLIQGLTEVLDDRFWTIEWEEDNV